MTNHHNNHDRPLGLSARTDRAVSWIGWHLGELTAVAVPLVLAAVVNGWWAVLSAVAAVGWTAHEVRLSRRQKALRAAGQRALPAASPSTDLEGVCGESA